MTMVDINNKVLNDLLIDMGIWIVEMNGWWCGWKPSKRNIILLEIKKVRVVNMMYNKTALYFVPLRFSRQEWSVASSIFNIKTRRLARCLLWIWMKLSQDKTYRVHFHTVWKFLLNVCKTTFFGNSDKLIGGR